MHKTRIQRTIYGTTELPFLITRIESNFGGPESKSNRRPQNRFFDASGRIVAPIELQRFTNSSIRFDSDTKDADSIIFDSICFLLTADVHI